MAQGINLRPTGGTLPGGSIVGPDNPLPIFTPAGYGVQLTDGTRFPDIVSGGTANSDWNEGLIHFGKRTDGTFSPLAQTTDGSLIVSGSFTTTESDTTGTGTITAINQTVVIAMAGKSGAGVQFTGTWDGNVGAYISMDGGTTYVQSYFWSYLNGVASGALSGSFSTPQVYGIIVGGGVTHVKVQADAWNSGTATVKMAATKENNPTIIASTIATQGGAVIPVSAVLMGGINNAGNGIVPPRLLTADPATSANGVVVRNIPAKSSSANASTSVTVTSSGQTVLAANTARTEAIVTNYGTVDCFLKYGSSPAVNSGILLRALTGAVIEDRYSGIITAIAATGATATVAVTEV